MNKIIWQEPRKRGEGENSVIAPPPQYDKEADFKSNISLHLRVPYSNNFFYSFLH